MESKKERRDAVSLKYKKLDDELARKIEQDRKDGVKNPYAFKNENAVRRVNHSDRSTLWRPSFVRDIEKIMHLPLYNRYADKTQVFSFYNNDDLSRRSLHVQLVSRIARNIGSVLGLNNDLIEAIALGHDIGHTPLGHAGERYLCEILCEKAGLFFNHNVQSARVIDRVFRRNVSLQTLDGILCHNGEFEMKEYRPCELDSFEEFDRKLGECYTDKSAIERLIPCTLEGCVVRICDMIAYLGKDRQDARTARMLPDNVSFSAAEIGTENAAIINNLTVDIIENSYGKDYILLSENAFCELKTAKKENYSYIYKNPQTVKVFDETIRPMFFELYDELLSQLERADKNSVIYKHHIDFVKKQTQYYGATDYEDENKHLIVSDFIASMTDDYFVELHKELFPKSKHTINYKGYFEDLL